jgi:hypothetical protein
MKHGKIPPLPRRGEFAVVAQMPQSRWANLYSFITKTIRNLRSLKIQ